MSYLIHLQVIPESKKSKQLSPVASPGASGTTEEEATKSDASSKTVPAGEAKGSESDPALEKARAAFQGLQASVVENAQVCVLFFWQKAFV